MASRQAVLGMERASFFYGSARVFGGITFLLDGARTALVGENGTGKSTLLKCLTGELELNGGKVIRSRGLRLGSVPQDVPEGLAALPVRDVLHRSLVKVGLGDDDWRIDVLVDEIGVEHDMLDRPFGALSGGWQRLLLIAAAARLEEPDILILDEPTNHLDLANIGTLERWLTVDFPVPMLIVSHDREFLNRVTDRTLFLRSDGMHAFKSPSARRARSCCAATPRPRRAPGSKTRRSSAWSRPRRATRCGRSRTPTSTSARTPSRPASPASRRSAPRPTSRANAGWSSPTATSTPRWRCAWPGSRHGPGQRPQADRHRPAGRRGRRSHRAPGRQRRRQVDPSDGAGRRRSIPNLEHYDGRSPIRFNPACRLVYFDQSMRDLPLDTSLLDYVLEVQGISEKDAIRQLAGAGFPFAKTPEPIAVLSHGERARLVFLRMKLLRPNMYLLDEPTNHLDIEGQEDLEEQLEQSEVSCLFVSHDRYFTRTVANRFLEIRKGRLVEIDSPESFFEEG